MPITYAYDEARGILETDVSGEIRPADAAAYFRQVGAEPWFPAPSVTDVRHASVVAGAEVRSIADSFRRFGPTLKDVPIAVLVDSQVAFGLVRMIGLILDDIATIAPFHDRQSAMAWVEANTPPVLRNPR